MMNNDINTNNQLNNNQVVNSGIISSTPNVNLVTSVVPQTPIDNQTNVPSQIVTNNENTPKANKEVIEILIEDILPNRFQPRLTFDMEALNELASSIREHGIIQPLIVRKLQDKYEIIAGERRYKAASIAGLSKVPCIIMNLDDNESAEVAVIENIQRKEMTPLEEAKSYKKILDKGYITQDELAKKLGKNQSTIANKLRLLNLDDTVQDAVLNEKISERHARSLLKIEDKQEQRNMLKEILDKRLTVRQLDDLIKEKYGPKEDNVTKNNENVPNNDVSVPAANIPAYNTQENNQQINIIKNTLNDVQNVIPQDQVNIFKFDTPQIVQSTDMNQILKPQVVSTPTSTIQEQISQPNSINDVLNPSVFSSTTLKETQAENKNEINIVNQVEDTNVKPSTLISPQLTGMNIDVQSIKDNAVDIIKPVEQANMNVLMSNDGTDKKMNRFVMDINNIETVDEAPSPKIEKIKSTINEVVNNLKLDGIYLEEEYNDLENKYEIILRLNK